MLTKNIWDRSGSWNRVNQPNLIEEWLTRVENPVKR